MRIEVDGLVKRYGRTMTAIWSFMRYELREETPDLQGQSGSRVASSVGPTRRLRATVVEAIGILAARRLPDPVPIAGVRVPAFIALQSPPILLAAILRRNVRRRSDDGLPPEDRAPDTGDPPWRAESGSDRQPARPPGGW